MSKVNFKRFFFIPAVIPAKAGIQRTPLPENPQLLDLKQGSIKVENHQKKKKTLEELFKTMLHKLMTGQIPAHDIKL